jgi:hypothetical protein
MNTSIANEYEDENAPKPDENPSGILRRKMVQ